MKKRKGLIQKIEIPEYEKYRKKTWLYKLFIPKDMLILNVEMKRLEHRIMLDEKAFEGKFPHAEN